MAEAVLELDISPALEALDSLSEAFDEITSGFGTAIADSLGSIGELGDFSGTLTDVLLPQIDEISAALNEATVGFGQDLEGAISNALLPQIDEVSAALSDVAPDLAASFDTTDIGGATDDVTDLSEGLDTLEASIGKTTDGMSLLNATTGGLQAATGLLEGQSASLIRTVVPGLAIFGGIGAAIGGLVESADAAEVSLSRMEDVFGSQAPSVFETKLEGLNISLGELNTKAGGSNTRLREAIATFGQTAIGAGAAKDEAAKVARSMGELSEIVTILNPKLGTADQNFQLLTRGLGGSTRILQRYGITIDKVAQNHLALEIAQQHGRQAATLFDKQVAGSVLSLQALEKQSRDSGTTLEERVNKGLDASTIQFRRLKQEIQNALVEIGKPLVEPVLKIVETLSPVFLKLIGIAGELLAKILPALVPIADAAVDILDALTPLLEVFKAIPTELITAIAVFEIFNSTLGKFDTILRGISKIFGPVVSGLTNLIPGVNNANKGLTTLQEQQLKTARSSGTLAQRIEGIAPNLLVAAAGIGIGIGSMQDFGQTTESTIGTIGGFAAAGASLGAVLAPESGGLSIAIGAAAGAVAGLTAGLIAGGESLEKYHDNIVKLAGVLASQTGLKQLTTFLNKIGDTDKAQAGLGNLNHLVAEMPFATKNASQAFDVLGNKVKGSGEIAGVTVPRYRAIAKELEDVSKGSGVAAREILNTLKTIKINGDTSYFAGARGAQGMNILLAAIERGDKARAKEAISTAKQQAADAALVEQMRQETIAKDEGVQAALRFVAAETQITAVTDDLVQKFGNVAGSFEDAWGKASEVAKAFGDGVVDSLSLEKALEATQQQGQEFADNLKVLIDNGLGVLASEIAQKGPEAGGKLAQQLADGFRNDDTLGIEAARKMQETAIRIKAQGIVFQEAIKNIWGRGVASEFTDQFNKAEDAVAEGLGLVYISLNTGGRKLVTKAEADAIALGAAYVESLNKTDVGEQVNAVFNAAFNKTADDETPRIKAKDVGRKQGEKIGEGTAEGIENKKPDVKKATAGIFPTPEEVGAPEKGKKTGTKYGDSIAGGVSEKEGDVHSAAKSIIPTGGVGAEDWGRVIGRRFGEAMADGIRSAERLVSNAVINAIPTGGVGARDAGFTIGQRFGEAMAMGMYSTADDVYQMGQYLAVAAKAGAANAGSPSVHLFSDLGEEFSHALAEGMERGVPKLTSVAQTIVRNLSSLGEVNGVGVPSLDGAAGSRSSVVHHTTDNSVRVDVGEVKGHDPRGVGIAIARRLRGEQFLK